MKEKVVGIPKKTGCNLKGCNLWISYVKCLTC